MAAKLRSGFLVPVFWTCSQKYSLCDSVSVVLPDLEATTNRVSSRSILARSARMVPGSVVSSTCSPGWPFTWPKVLRSTSGPRLDPPMPSSTTSE